MTSILAVLGTRPEVIKLGPVIRELYRHPGVAACRVCIASQHQHMLEPALALFGIVPDYD